MADVKINTATVLDVASIIETNAKSIADCLAETSTAVSNLSDSWVTAAGANARTNYQIFANANFPGFSGHIRQYGTFLREQVGEGYTATEENNEDLADMYE